MHLQCKSVQAKTQAFDASAVDIKEAAERVLSLPRSPATFLITIGDRSITGTVARDQFVGPWQVPVADVADYHLTTPTKAKPWRWVSAPCGVA